MTRDLALTVLRIFVALIFIIHGVARSMIFQTVGGFGEFLDSKGFPGGFYIAWCITLFELTGGTAMALNKFTPYISLGFIAHQIMAILLVHAGNGWFVVGASTGGMEYSLLIIVSLFVIYVHSRKSS